MLLAIENAPPGRRAWYGMGLDKEAGTIEVAKRADLILLDANPLDDIHNIRSVRYVVANGVLFTLFHLHQPWSMRAELDTVI